jgi:hypothetical protein
MIKTVLDDSPNGFYNIPDSVYFDADGLSNSSMGLITKSYAHFLNRDSFKPTPAMQLGTLVHLMVLEPHLFDDKVAVAEKVDMRTKAGKEYKKQFDELNRGKLIVSPETHKTASRMAENVLGHPRASELLEFTEREIASFKQYDEILIKGKADIWAPGQYVADLKTTTDASEGTTGFAKSILNFQYYKQAAVYQELFDVDKFYFIAVENKEPYLVNTFFIDEDYINAGKKLMRKAIKRFKDLQGADLSKINLGYDDKLHSISCPYWLAERPEAISDES